MKYTKKILALILAMALVLTLGACGDKGEKHFNPLTGEYTLDQEATRPVAVVINNLSVTQDVQAGVAAADIVFETEVEGGVTRLMAVYSDISKVGKIGSLHGLRTAFAEIAWGMKALLLYNEMDEIYCRRVVEKSDMIHAAIEGNKYCAREENGLIFEHRLYTSGSQLANLIADKGLDTNGSGEPWLLFSEDSSKIAAGSAAATNITVKYSTTSITKFIYDKDNKKYIRSNKKDVPFTDYETGEQELFTNVFVLETSIQNYSDNYTQNVDLSSGKGYYISAGGVVEILWSKGDSASSLVLTTTSGETLTVNQGKSYFCIVDGTVTVE